MGRNKIKFENQKVKISISISSEINKKLEDLSINKSKLINKLLQKSFKTTDEKN